MNKSITKLISMFLAAAMVLCLCACSLKPYDEESEQPQSQKGDSAKPKSGKTDLTDTPKRTYVAEYMLIESGEVSLSPLLYTDEGVYCSVSEKAEGEGAYDVYKAVLYFIDYAGNKAALPDFRALDPAQCGQMIPKDVREAYQSCDILDVIDSGDGRLVLLESIYTGYYDAPADIARDTEQYKDSFKSEEQTVLRVITKTGAEESCHVLDTPPVENLSTIHAAVCDGQLVCAIGNSVIVFGLDASRKYSLDSYYWFDRILMIEGKAYAVASFDERTELIEVDLKGRTFGEKKSLDLNGWDFTVGGGDYDVYSNSGTSLIGYDLETGKIGEVLSWLSCNMNGYDLNPCYVCSDDSIVTVENRWDKDHKNCENSIILLHTGTYEPAPQNVVLTLACKSLNDSLMQAVNDFNRENEWCRIEVTDYSQYNVEGDWNAGVLRLNTEIMAGNTPDIIVLDGLPAKQYAARGLLADLYPFIDADSELDRSDFFESILRACENNGKLYTTVSGFSIDTCIGASVIVGDRPGWNYEQFMDALASMPEGCTPFNQFTSRDTVLFYILALELDRFVDWNTGTCCFDSPEFIELLEFARTFPESGTGAYGGTEDAEPNRIASGKQMLMRNGIYSFSDFQMYDAIFGGSCTYIGYPTSYGTGNMIQLDSGYAISATCKAPEAAWKFVRTFFTAEYQRGLEWSLPSNREVFNEKLTELMTPVYLQDENGGYVLDENGSKIETDQGTMKLGDIVIGYKALTQAQAEKIITLVESTDRLYGYDESIASIITAEAPAFFYGQKSAEDVAKLIQSRASIYVSERG